MKIKFKYIPFRVRYEGIDLMGDFKTVAPPLPYKNLPEGEYLIRGNKKSHRRKYWLYNNVWFLVEDETKDRGQYYCDSCEYMLFSSLSEKEWKNIENVGVTRLNKLWQRHLYGYKHWKNLREISRDIKKDFLNSN